MTSPDTASETSATEPKAESFVDWFHINSRLVSIGAGVVLLAAIGFWFVQRTRLNETISSDRQLLIAKQSLGSGNEALALADLKKVVDKYGDKPAGAEAGMLIATTQMEKGDYKSAITGLKDLVAKNGDGPNSAPVHSLLGDAMSQSGQAADAAAEYEKAAALSAMLLEKISYQSKAGRAYAAAGKNAEAKRVLELVANQSDYAALANEAKVRLGELSAGAKP